MAKQVSNEQYDVAYGNNDNKSIMLFSAFQFKDFLDHDERIECGLHGLWRTLKSHQSDKGQKFTTSLFKFVRWECLKMMNQKRKQKNKADRVLHAEKKRSHHVQLPISLETMDLLDKIPQKERTFLNQRFFEGRTLAEIGRLHGFTREAARQNIDKALAKLQKMVYNIAQ